ncbi:MAG: MBL fold metallo-hydrolase [Gracilibacteraceae bacterium]|jgi:glyoxylase-like metal-dependent hydrolase (beta-lactamase superfamily II)|nr:MBL fold metallo-hydrolase [Gracilibacteraceae bacterium]
MMIEEIAPDIFLIRVPLPHTPLRELNAYLLRGRAGEKDILVDLGFDLDVCEAALRAALREVGAKAGFDILLTHFHLDHAGLLPRMATADTTVYHGKIPWEMIRQWEQMSDPAEGGKFLRQSGVERDLAEIKSIPREFEVDWREMFAQSRSQELREGERLTTGNYQWRCFETDGHCEGHICLYEPETKLLLAGDHILGHISPNITCYNMGAASSLRKYLHSLDKIADLDVKLVLPAHREPLTDCRARIKELQTHHERRLEEIKNILAAGPQTGMEITGKINWAARPAEAEEQLRFYLFALGETLAHINYLLEVDQAEMTEADGRLYYQGK